MTTPRTETYPGRPGVSSWKFVFLYLGHSFFLYSMSAFLINPCKFLVGKVVNSDTIPVGRSSKSYRWRLRGRAGSVSILTGWLFQDRGKISFMVSFSRIDRKEYCWKNYYSSIVNACYLRVNCKGRNHGWDDNRRSLFKICINMWTVSSDVSIQAPHWQRLSVHLRAYSTHPTHDVTDVWRLTTPPGIVGIRRLLLPISANNRRTTLFPFESSRVTATSKMVDY